MLAAPTVTEATFALWQRIAKFPASNTDGALRHLQEWIAETFGADNVIWVGGVRALSGEAAAADAFLGWRLRERVALRPDPAPYRKQLAEYYDIEHYGKLTPTYYERSHEAKKEDHVGMDSRALMAGCGGFRVVRIRDDNFVNFSIFKETSHYKRYYRDGGIEDRVAIGFPITATRESFFMIDRFQETKPRRRHFSLREATQIGDAVRGLPELHRRLFLGSGLLMTDKPLSPVERQILQGLLTSQSEKEIAASLVQKLPTLHKYVTGLYALYGVNSRQGLMSLWLGGNVPDLQK